MTQNYQSLVLELTQLPSEVEWVEFKHNYHSAEEIGELISALANSACIVGQDYGYLIFGVKDNTHEIVGTTFAPKKQKAKGNEDLEFWLTARLSPKINFTIHEFQIDNKPIVLFQIPATRQEPIQFLHEAYIRIGSLRKPLKSHPDKARLIWQTMADDWSAKVITEATIADLDPNAIAFARQKYSEKNNSNPRLLQEIATWDDVTFLNKIKATVNGKITNTAIILLGLLESTHYLSPAQAKITWILKGVDGMEKDFEHFEPPFLLAVDNVFSKIRNLKYRYLPYGTLFPDEVEQYDPYIIRESLSNAIGHQDYTQGGRITVVEKEDSTLTFQNYGSFLPHTIENVLIQDAPSHKYRNSRLIDVMVNLKMMETIGSGIRRMFDIQRQRYFPMPDYTISKDKVLVKITGKVLNQDYAKQLANMPNLNLLEVVALDKVQKNQEISEVEANELRKKYLIEGRKPNYIISANIAEHTELQAEYMQMKGIDEVYYREMILEYLRKFESATLSDFETMLSKALPQVLDDNQRKNRVRNLLQKLRKQGLVQSIGRTWQLAKDS